MTRSWNTGQARTFAGIGAIAAAIALGAPAVAALGDEAAPHIRAVSTAPTPDIEKSLGPHTTAVAAAEPAPTTTVDVSSSGDAPPDVSVDAPVDGGSSVKVETNGAPDIAVSADATSSQHAGPSSVATTAAGSSNAPNGTVSTSSSQMSQSSPDNKGGTTVVQRIGPDDVLGPGMPSMPVPQVPNVPTAGGFGR